MIDKKAYYNEILRRIAYNMHDLELLKLIIPDDIVSYAKLDLETMKNIDMNSFSLHAEKNAMASSHTYDISLNRDPGKEASYTVSVVDNDSKIKRIYHSNNGRSYIIKDPNDSRAQIFSRCMTRRTQNDMYIMFYDIQTVTILYYNRDSTEIIGNSDTDILTISNAYKYGFLPDGHVKIYKSFNSMEERIAFFENIEEEYSKEISKLELK